MPQDLCTEHAASTRAVAPESDQEKSLREWGENYDRVAATDDLSTVSAKDLIRAIGWASNKLQMESRKGWNGGINNPNLIAALRRELDFLKAEEAKRRDPAFGRINLQDRVLVVDATKQARINLGPAKYPGRVGTVVRENLLGRGDRGSLWYVLLDATKRGPAREETFWGDMLAFSGPAD